MNYAELELGLTTQAAWFREAQLRGRRAWARSLVVDLVLENWNSPCAGPWDWSGRLHRRLVPVIHEGKQKLWEVEETTYERLFGRGDIHRAAAQMFHKMEEAVTREERAAAQIAVFTALYGGARVDTGRFSGTRELPRMWNR